MEFQLNDISYAQALFLYKSYQPLSLSTEILPPKNAEGEHFGRNFPGNLIQKPFYKNCTFTQSKFNSPNGAYARFHDCCFFDCNLYNGDFRYNDIVNTKFISQHGKNTIKSCNFSFSNFINTTLEKVNISGTSFRQMRIEDCVFDNTIIAGSSFEETLFKNCVF